MNSTVELFILLISVFTIARSYVDGHSFNRFSDKPEIDRRYYEKNDDGQTSKKRLAFVAIVIILTLFCGMRTWYNDTYTYIKNFRELDISEKIEWKLSENPGFVLYQIFIKKFLANNSQVFLFLTASITVALNLRFLKKYSLVFSTSVFLYITAGTYVFAFGATKQAFATALGLWAIDFALRKKWIRFIALTAIASSIHMFAILFFITPFFIEEVWNKRVVGVLLFSMTVGTVFNQFVLFIIKFVGLFGDEIDEEVLHGSGVNVLRLAFFAIPVIASWIYRERIREENSRTLNLCTNFSVISFSFMLISMFGNPIYFGRMANYFQVFSVVTMVFILYKCVPKGNRKNMITYVMCLYAIFFYFSFKIYRDAGLIDYFYHNKFSSLFDGWVYF